MLVLVMDSQERLRPWKLEGEMYSSRGQLSISSSLSPDSFLKFWSSRAGMARCRSLRVTSPLR